MLSEKYISSRAAGYSRLTVGQLKDRAVQRMLIIWWPFSRANLGPLMKVDCPFFLIHELTGYAK